VPPRAEPVYLIPLGGAGEVGKNMFAVRYANQILLVDGGLSRPTTTMLGVKCLLPALDWILEHRDKLVGWILTHGHEDHIGGLPHMVTQLPRIPIFGAKLTLGLLKSTLTEAGIDPQGLDLREVQSNGRVTLGTAFTVDLVRMTHSIPDNSGLIIQTPRGRIVYTGDFKLEHHPADRQTSELYKLARAGQEGVLALLSDSSNAERPGYTPSERTVREGVARIVARAQQRVIIATPSDNIHRLQSFVDVAKQHGRRVVFMDPWLTKVTKLARELSYLEVSQPLLSLNEAGGLPNNELLVLCSGTQGDPEGVLSQLAAGTHPQLSVNSSDTVIVSASPLPGNIEAVDRMLNRLAARGIDLYYPPYHPVHASGHASQEELKLVLELTRPKYFLPWHGELRHQTSHLRLAQGMTRPPQKWLTASNGDMVELGDTLRIVSRIETGVIYVDRAGTAGKLSDPVMRDRQMLAQQGALVIMVILSLVPTIEVISLGGLHVSPKLREEIIQIALEGVKRGIREKRDLKTIRDDIFYPVRRYIRKQTSREPLIIPSLVEG